MIVADADCPSTAAITLAMPLPTAVTSPLPETVATDCGDEDQLMVLPATIAPLVAFGVAVRRSVSPTEIVALAGLTSTVETVRTPVRPGVWSPLLPPPHAARTSIVQIFFRAAPVLRVRGCPDCSCKSASDGPMPLAMAAQRGHGEVPPGPDVSRVGYRRRFWGAVAFLTRRPLQPDDVRVVRLQWRGGEDVAVPAPRQGTSGSREARRLTVSPPRRLRS